MHDASNQLTPATRGLLVSYLASREVLETRGRTTTSFLLNYLQRRARRRRLRRGLGRLLGDNFFRGVVEERV